MNEKVSESDDVKRDLLSSLSSSVNDPAASSGLRNLVPTILGHPVAGPSSKIRPSGDSLGTKSERSNCLTEGRRVKVQAGWGKVTKKGRKDETEADAEKRHRLILEYLIRFLDMYL